MLKFLVDESSGNKLVKSLKKENYDALYCRDLFPGASDEVILDMSKIYHQSMTDGRKPNVLAQDDIFSSMLKNHRYVLAK